MNISDTRAIITGGVSGLGFAVAQHIVAHGGKVALFDINSLKAAEAITSLGAGNAAYFSTDVSDEDQVAENTANQLCRYHRRRTGSWPRGLHAAGPVLHHHPRQSDW